MDITTEDNIFVYKLFDQRSVFSFFIAGMPYQSSNISSSVFYGSIFSEFLPMTWFTLRLTDFVLKASQWCTKMIRPGGGKIDKKCQTDKKNIYIKL